MWRSYLVSIQDFSKLLEEDLNSLDEVFKKLRSILENDEQALIACSPDEPSIQLAEKISSEFGVEAQQCASLSRSPVLRDRLPELNVESQSLPDFFRRLSNKHSTIVIILNEFPLVIKDYAELAREGRVSLFGIEIKEDHFAEVTQAIKEDIEILTQAVQSENPLDRNNIQNDLNKLEELLKRNEEQVAQLDSRGFTSFDLDGCLQSLKELQEDVLELTREYENKLPKEYVSPGKVIKIKACYFSYKRESWVIKVENISEKHLRKVTVCVEHPENVLAEFKVIEGQTIIKKLVNFDGDLKFRHLLALHNGKPVSLAYIVNTVFMRQINDYDSSFGCLVKNQTSEVLSGLKLMSNMHTEAVMNVNKLKPLATKEIIVERSITEFGNGFLFLSQEDNIVSNQLLV